MVSVATVLVADGVAIVLVADGVVLLAVAVGLLVPVADTVGIWVVVSFAPSARLSVGFDGPKGVPAFGFDGFELLTVLVVEFDCSTTAGGVNWTVGVEITAIRSNG